MRTSALFKMNPIIIKELRSRMRGPRAFITLTILLLLLAGISYGVFKLSLNVYGSYTGTPISPQIGQTLFTMLVFLLLFVICIITPAVTAGTISSEKENLTFEMLLSTPLHPVRILWGKLISSISYVFLLIFAAIPIASLIFVFGGVSLRDMVKSLVVLIAIAITTGVFGVFMSSLLKRTARATVVSYIIIALLMFGTLFAYAMVGVFSQDIPPRWILAINPLSALASSISNLTYNYAMGFIPVLGADLSSLSGNAIGIGYIPRPLYHYSVPLYAFISLILFLVAARLVSPTRRWRITRKEILIILAIVLVMASAIAAGFYFTTGNYEQISQTNTWGQQFWGVEQAAPAVIEVPVEKITSSDNQSINTVNTTIEITIQDQAFFYSEIVREIINKYQEIQPLELASIELVQTFNDPALEAGMLGEPYLMPDPVQMAVLDAIQLDPQPEFRWVATIADLSVSNDQTGIAFGDLTILTETLIEVPAGIFVDGKMIGLELYSFTNADGIWQIVSPEGSQ